MEIIQNKPLKTIWLKAAVAGSLWASVEIIVGSFLHNLRIPFSGAILSFVGVYLMIAFLQVWKEKGLIIRAGLICAFMKSISPSAIILGPMIGIITEALLLELFIFLFGKNLFGYIIAGAFAVFSTLLHKVISFLIMYGTDLVKIAGDLYHFLLKELNIPNVSPVYLLLIISAIYIAAGVTAAVLGYLAGKKYLEQRPTGGTIPDFVPGDTDTYFSQTPGREYSVIFFFLNIVMVGCSLFLINSGYLLPALAVAILYLAFCIYRYKNAMRRLQKISIWIQFVIITLMAGLLWKGIAGEGIFSFEGLMVGLKMVFRAIILLFGFSAISVELKNPLIKSLLYKRGFASLYQSIGLAFSALPGIMATIPDTRDKVKKTMSSFPALFRKAEDLYSVFEKEHRMRPPVIIITGEIGQGKTTFTEKVVAGLALESIHVRGFLARGIHEVGQRTGFELEEIGTGLKTVLCSRDEQTGWSRTGHYFFNPDTIQKGNDILSAENPENKLVMVIDEIGPLELNRLGWSYAIEKLCRKPGIIQIWVVRKKLVSQVAHRWNTGDVYVFDISRDEPKDVVEQVCGL